MCVHGTNFRLRVGGADLRPSASASQVKRGLGLAASSRVEQRRVIPPPRQAPAAVDYAPLQQQLACASHSPRASSGHSQVAQASWRQGDTTRLVRGVGLRCGASSGTGLPRDSTAKTGAHTCSSLLFCVRRHESISRTSPILCRSRSCSALGAASRAPHSAMEPHTPLRRGPGAGSGANLVRALASYLVDPALEVSKSTSADGSPHTSSKHTTRVQLKSPFRDMVAPDSAEQATNTTNIPMVDLDSAQPAGSAAAASTGAASAAAAAAVAEACPSLLLPYPHRRPATINVLHDLQSRQCRTVGVSPVSFKRRTRGHQFGRFELRRSASTFDAVAAAPPELELVNLQKKSKIMEIVSAGNFVFALTHAGVCVAFDNRECTKTNRTQRMRTDLSAHRNLPVCLPCHPHPGTMKRLCYLNIISDEVIRSLFHNKVNQSLITVSVYRHDNFTSLRCRSTPFESVRTRKCHSCARMYFVPVFADSPPLSRLCFSSSERSVRANPSWASPSSRVRVSSGPDSSSSTTSTRRCSPSPR